jgi:nucleotide-binding universal stress UspA family protein
MARTIVVGYEDKEPAKRALEYAIEQAKESGGRLVVIAVAEMPLNPESLQNYGTLDDSPTPVLPIEAPPDLEAVLAHAREQIDAGGGPEAEYAWAAGDPSSSIEAIARDRKADLVVLGSHHHNALARFLGADVADQVKRHLDTNVVVVE